MYKEHSIFQSPLPDAILWRYMDFTKFVSMLQKQALFFARADKLGDPFEGSFSKANKKLRPVVYDNLKIDIQRFDKFYEQLKEYRRFMLINCWHKSPHESEAMWKLYAREQDGIVIKTDFNSLKTNFECDTIIFIGEVDYVDYNTHFINEGNTFGPYLCKRESFKHEQEVRAIVDVSFAHTSSEYKNIKDDLIGGVYYKVNLSLLIKEVIVAPFAPDWFFELVKEIVDLYSFNFPVTKSTLGEEPIWS